jgi:rod shape-determining protein MreD
MAYFFLPALVSAVVALAACLPWGATEPVQFALPLLTMAVIFYWTINRRDQMPTPLVFLFGLFTDLATAGPLGYWALNFLIAVTIAHYGIDRYADGRGWLTTLSFFAIAVSAVSAAGWLLSSLFFLRTMPARPLLQGGLIAIAAYPVISYLLTPINHLVGFAAHAYGLEKDDRR